MDCVSVHHRTNIRVSIVIAKLITASRDKMRVIIVLASSSVKAYCFVLFQVKPCYRARVNKI